MHWKLSLLLYREWPFWGLEGWQRTWFSWDVTFAKVFFEMVLPLSVWHSHMPTEKFIKIWMVGNKSVSLKPENRYTTLLCTWEAYITFLYKVLVKPWFSLYLKVSHTKQIPDRNTHDIPNGFAHHIYLMEAKWLLSEAKGCPGLPESWLWCASWKKKTAGFFLVGHTDNHMAGGMWSSRSSTLITG